MLAQNTFSKNQSTIHSHHSNTGKCITPCIYPLHSLYMQNEPTSQMYES